MYQFKDKDEIDIPVSCKICLKEIKFKISKDEYKEVKKFPIKKEYVHGDPPHKLVVFINQYLEVENFEIKDVVRKEEEVVYSEELTRQVLSEIDLNDEEIELYFRTTGREAVSLGEMALLIGKSKEECKSIADKFVEKGLFREIIGATPHYAALPPYAALVAQLRSFYDFISNIKSKLPTQLDKAFTLLESEAKDMEKLKDSSELIGNLKQKMIDQIYAQKKEFDDTIAAIDNIRNISVDVSSLGDFAKTISEEQIGDLTKQFENLNTKTSQIINNQLDALKDQFDELKEIIAENLRKLRLGVLQQTVVDVIEKIIANRLKEITDNINIQLSVSQTVFVDELRKATQGLDTEIISNLKKTIEDAVKNIKGIAAVSGEDTDKIFAEISENFDKAIKMAEEKIGGVSGGMFESFGNIKDIFSKEIVDTLNNTLEDILKRLEISEITTKEFWDQAKRGTLFTMKDIWFIRSMESAKAHINDEIAKAKMRVLIVAPQITDLDIDAIKARPSRINFRIASYIDPTSPVHEAILRELDKMDNVDYRNRTLQNLWGINRDYEEVILCVLSKTEFRGETIIEIAGIGSIIEEHIKIFVPVLEDAWVSARKEIMRSIKSSLSKEEPQLEPVVDEPKVLPKKVKEAPLPAKAEPEEKKPSFLSKQFNDIINNLDKMTGIEISSTLERFQSEYVKIEGYNSILKNIHNVSTELKKNSELLSRPEREELKLSMRSWKEKLNL
ncbi:MAG: hypothetical protein ACFE8L_06065 [Candidatus Hodarchaeota archaeon]